jgi:predicted RNase H-like nuclease (RuvC/YqgF family)
MPIIAAAAVPPLVVAGQQAVAYVAAALGAAAVGSAAAGTLMNKMEKAAAKDTPAAGSFTRCDQIVRKCKALKEEIGRIHAEIEKLREAKAPLRKELEKENLSPGATEMLEDKLKELEDAHDALSDQAEAKAREAEKFCGRRINGRLPDAQVEIVPATGPPGKSHQIKIKR